MITLEQRKSQIGGAGLDVSVVFATRNRAEQLRETLASYEKLDTQALQWELVVINNGSSDDTLQVLETYANRLPLRWLSVAEPGQNRARNAALDSIRSHLVVFTDDDVLPEPNYLNAYVEACARWPNDAIFGACVCPAFPAEAPGWMTRPDFEFSSTAFARYAPAESEGVVSRHPYGPSFAILRKVIADRRFNEDLGPQTGSYAMGGEGAFLRALAEHGHRYIYVPSACVRHVVRPEQVSEAWLLSRARKKGRGQFYLSEKRYAERIKLGGVPFKLWLAVVRGALRYRLSCLMTPVGAESRIKRGIDYMLRAGLIEEFRRHRDVK